MIRGAIQGFEREIYNNPAIVIDQDCFSDFYVQKHNEYQYLYLADPFENFYYNLFPEMQILYMFAYMVWSQCDIGDTFNEFMIFCWYKGCWPQQLLADSEHRILYILRAVNEAAILWNEQLPKSDSGEPIDADEQAELEKKLNNPEPYLKVAGTVGETIAQIFRDITGFVPVPREERI